MDKYKVILFFVLMLLLFVRYIRNNSNNLIGVCLIGIYTFSAFMGIMLYDEIEYSHISGIAYLALFCILYICFYPILSNKYNTTNQILGVHGYSLKIICTCLIVLYIPSVAVSLITAYQNFSSLMTDLSIAADMYRDAADYGRSQTGSSLSNIPSVIRGCFSEIVIFLFFYCLTLQKRKKTFFTILLGISMTYAFVASFNQGSRTAMTYWILQCAIAFMLFYPYYSGSVRRKGLIGIVTVGTIVLTVFMALTIGRFSTGKYSNDDYTKGSLISYSGQGTLNFANDALENDVFQWGDGTMPFFRRIVGLESSDNLYERQEKWASKMKIKQGCFYTFVGDLTFDFTIIGAFVFLSYISYMVYRRTQFRYTTASIDKLFLFYFWCSVCFCGLFYLSYKTVGGNLKIITNILFYLYLKHNLVKIN